MKHLEPQAQHNRHPAANTARRKKNTGALLATAALALILGTGYALTAFVEGSPSDDIPASTKSQLINEFAQAKQFKLTPVPASELDAALDSMKLSADQRQSLKNSLTPQPGSISAENTLGWIELWDFAEQDGDVVHISSSGYEVDYPLLNVPSRIAIPVDASLSVTIRGVQDGGGGITLGLRTGAVGISLPVIAPGQSLVIPVTF